MRISIFLSLGLTSMGLCGDVTRSVYKVKYLVLLVLHIHPIREEEEKRRNYSSGFNI